MKINVETIPHSCQRYDTVGDWTFEPDGTLNVNVSEMIQKPTSICPITVKHEDSEFLVAIHEIVEAYLCKKAGITAEEVDAFDIEYKDHSPNLEPGDSTAAPYHVQHLIATSIEMMLCAALNLNWSEHERRVDSLG